jgi:hypothetical protein
MSTEVKTLQLTDLQLSAQGVPPLPESKQLVWNLMGQAKVAMDQALQRVALEIQQHLANYQTMDQATLDKGLVAYRECHKKMVGIRQGYTGYLDAAKEMCMATEKTWDPKTNETYKLASTREFTLRDEAQKKAVADQAKETEVQMFRSFIVNEYHDMVQGYKAELFGIIQQAYTTCLEQRTPVENTTVAITAAVGAMREVRPRTMGKYDRKLLTDAEAMKLFESVPAPTWQNHFNDAIEYLKSKFKLYGNDLANAEKALEQQKITFEQQQQAQKQEHEATQAANTLLAQATIPIVTPPGMKPIIETTVIEVPTVLDWAWEMRIVAAFLANAQLCQPKVKTKKGGALTTGQMAAALDAAGVKVDGIKYAEIKK